MLLNALAADRHRHQPAWHHSPARPRAAFTATSKATKNTTAAHTRAPAPYTLRFSRAVRFDVLVADGSPDAGGHLGHADVPGDHLLRTRVFDERSAHGAARVAVRLCQHFERHGVCSRGFKCRFAHRVGSPPGQGPAAPVAVRVQPRFLRPGAAAGARADALGERSGTTTANTTPTAATTASRPESSGLATVAGHSPPPLPPPRVQHRGSRWVVATPGGWRHAAYDAPALN
jgi:hypothetical protein